jgi:hypothetical protein
MNRNDSSRVDLNSALSRRTVIKTALLGAAVVPATLFLSTAQGAAAPLVPLDPNDPQAKALGYVVDTTKVDAKTNTTHTPEQKCAKCLQFQGKPTDKTGGCNIFMGKSVAANGWCKVYGAKPGA